jgi:UDP-glucose 4-epimerase
MTNSTILVTGGWRYIGTLTITVLIEQGIRRHLIVLLSQLELGLVGSVTEFANYPRRTNKRLVFHQTDVCDDGSAKVFESSALTLPFLHFAGLKVRPCLYLFYSVLLM